MFGRALKGARLLYGIRERKPPGRRLSVLPGVKMAGYKSATEILDELDRGASGEDMRVSSSGDDELGGVIFICR